MGYEHRWTRRYYAGRGIFTWGPVITSWSAVLRTPRKLGDSLQQLNFLVEDSIVANTTWWSSSARWHRHRHSRASMKWIRSRSRIPATVCAGTL